MKYIIAREAEDQGYGHAQGVIAWIEDDKAYISHFSHCSCNGTIDSLNGVESQEIDYLVKCAYEQVDTDIPTATVEDTHLLEVYKQIVNWDKAGRPLVSSEFY